jgi:hypothetical protein
MIRDRDCIYGAVVTRRPRAMGIRDKPIAPASDQIDRLSLVVVHKRPTLTFFHLTPPGSLSLLQVSINSEEVQNPLPGCTVRRSATVRAPSKVSSRWSHTTQRNSPLAPGPEINSMRR